MLRSVLIPSILTLTAVACSSDPALIGSDTDVRFDADAGRPDAAGAIEDLGSAEGDAATSDLGGRTDMPPTSGPPFAIPGAQGTYEINFTASISGSSNAPIGDIAITNGWGTVELNGAEVPIALYERQEWDAFGYTLYQGLAVDRDRWWVLWFYCREASGLTDIYFQGTTGPTLDVVRATGTCDATTTPSSVTVDFPPAMVGVDLLADGFTVTGPTIDIRPGEVGLLTVGNTPYEVYPFGHVDCTTECGPDGWHELHSLIRDPATGELCFVIFYLYADNRQAIGAYAFSLPGLGDPINGTLGLGDVTWSR